MIDKIVKLPVIKKFEICGQQCEVTQSPLNGENNDVIVTLGIISFTGTNEEAQNFANALNDTIQANFIDKFNSEEYKQHKLAL